MVDRASTPSDHPLSRRDFMVISAGVFGTAGFIACRKEEAGGKPTAVPEGEEPPKVTLSLTEYPTLREPNAGVELAATPTRPALLVIRAGTEAYAYANLCTHAACNLLYEPDNQIIYCNPDCGHGSVYTLMGEVARGPSVHPLYRFPAELDASKGILTVTLKVMS